MPLRSAGKRREPSRKREGKSEDNLSAGGNPKVDSQRDSGSGVRRSDAGGGGRGVGFVTERGTDESDQG